MPDSSASLSQDSLAAPGSGLSHQDVLRILSGVLLAMFLSALDQTIVATALPRMATELGGLQHLSWIVSGYLLTSTASTPIYGKLSDMIGRRRMLLSAIGIFVASSVLCALAQNMTQIVGARALQGVGGGGLLSMAQATIADIIAPRERGRYQAYFSGSYAVATISGPVLGGVLADDLSWRFIFWINLPLGLLAWVLVRNVLRRLPATPQVRRRIDYSGAALFIACVVCFLLVASWGGTQFGWTAPEIWGLAALGLVLLGLLILQERRAPEPILAPRLFSNPVVRLACLTSFVVVTMQLGLSVMVPSFLQLVHGLSASDSGLLAIPMTIGGVTGSFTIGRIMRRTGRYKPAAMAGLSLAACALLFLAAVVNAHSLPLIIAAMTLVSLGTSASFPAMMVAGQNGAELRDIGIVTSMITFSRSLGGSFGTAILWSAMVTSLLAGLAAAGTPHLADALLQGGTAAAKHLPAEAQAVLHPALVHAYRRVFLICAGIAVIAVSVLAFMPEKPLRTEAAVVVRRRAAE